MKLSARVVAAAAVMEVEEVEGAVLEAEVVAGGPEEEGRGGRRGRRRTTSTRSSRGSLTRQATDEAKVVLR